MLTANTETTDNEQGNNTETQRYLAHIENRLYQDICARRRLDSGLLFLSCQISACSVAWLLFQLQVTLAVIQVASFCIGLLPGLIDVGDSFSISISSQGWDIRLGDKPLVGIVKLAIGASVSLSGTAKITEAVYQTEAAIAKTYQEIRSMHGRDIQLPGISILIAIAAVVLIGVIKKIGAKNEEVEI